MTLSIIVLDTVMLSVVTNKPIMLSADMLSVVVPCKLQAQKVLCDWTEKDMAKFFTSFASTKKKEKKWLLLKNSFSSTFQKMELNCAVVGKLDCFVGENKFLKCSNMI
jgi:hypothetical protein